jgi:beta-N-acetylhexosaminidase
MEVARLHDAARRTAALALPAAGTRAPDVGDDVAARCIEITGRLPALHAPIVVECRPPAGMASGELPWSLGDPLAALLPGTDVVATTGPRALDSDRDLVLVVRDPQRATWQQPMIDAAAAHPRAAVVVDCGWPAELTPVPLVRTRGVAPALLRAAAHTLAAGGTR